MLAEPKMSVPHELFSEGNINRRYSLVFRNRWERHLMRTSPTFFE